MRLTFDAIILKKVYRLVVGRDEVPVEVELAGLLLHEPGGPFEHLTGGYSLAVDVEEPAVAGDSVVVEGAALEGTLVQAKLHALDSVEGSPFLLDQMLGHFKGDDPLEGPRAICARSLCPMSFEADFLRVNGEDWEL